MENFTEYDAYLFGQGTHYDIYKKMGAHIKGSGRDKGVNFAVWAPNAKKVYVFGDFNGWNEEANEMTGLGVNGIFETFVKGAKEGDKYKYIIETYSGEKIYKADPYASAAELRPGTNSVVADTDSIKWTDDEWMEKRRKVEDVQREPLNIYEVHPGSWMRHLGYNEKWDGYYSYRELAVALTKYVKKMGYTHVEFLGISEYPFEGSWGYQVTGYYAPTSRYGSPKDFAYMINYMHKHGIGVILDWVPAHFPKDAYALANFDGQPLYEYPDPRMGEHPEWGTKVFNYAKNEVRNFLIGSALQWVEKYHVDGLRVDAVASMLYLNYAKKEGEWIPNKYGDERNLDAIEFFKHLNTLILGRNKGVMMIAEESTSWPKITGDAHYDGLGFSYKWNMGWMHDFLDYMKLDPLYRKSNHNKMTFAMAYNHSENFILVLSHDEVVHLKCSMIVKMPGVETERFRHLMTGYTFMMGHPGKKLLFMGQEFGQYREWSEARELDWFLLTPERPEHEQLQSYVAALNKLYKKYPAMYEFDNKEKGFEWINADDADRSIFSFVRHGKKDEDSLLFVCNFTPVDRHDYRVGVPCKGNYKLLLTTDEEQYGGTGAERPLSYKAVESECDRREYSFAFDLPGLSAAVFKFKRK